MSRRALSGVVLGLGLGLAGCAHYAPAQLPLARFPASLESRQLAPTPDGRAWAAADLLAVAMAQNPQIAEARARYATALAMARAARVATGPSLTLTAEYAHETPRWGYGGSSDLPLDRGARRDTRVTIANLQALQAYYDLGDTIWSIRTDLERASRDREAAVAEIGLAQQSVDLRRARAERLAQRVAAGQDAGAVAVAAQSDLVAAERRRAAAGARRIAAEQALAKALGVGPSAVRDLVLAPRAPAPSLADLPTWRRDAPLSRRDVLRAVADYDIAENTLRQQVAAQFPAISVGPAYNYDHGVAKFPINLSLVLPPWDLNRGPIAEAEAARAAAGRSLELTQANVLAAVDAAAAALSAARDDLDRMQAHDLPLAQKLRAAVERAAAAGAADRTDELAAKAAWLDAELNLNDAQHAVATANADLQDALRRSFDPAETAAIAAAMVKGKGPA